MTYEYLIRGVARKRTPRHPIRGALISYSVFSKPGKTAGDVVTEFALFKSVDPDATLFLITPAPASFYDSVEVLVARTEETE